VCCFFSAIKGHTTTVLAPANSYLPGPLIVKDDVTRHIVFTAETHNFPTGVAPFPGATTGTGGRIRDVQSTGRGAYVVAGTAGYSFGNLLLPGTL
jgi:phosphoribosylformylglycinamidine synthase